MGPFRRLLSDRLNGGMLAALLAYALLFQAVGGSVAGAGMAAAALESRGGAHASHAVHDGGQPGLPECCTTLCAIACAAGGTLTAELGGADLGPALVASAAVPAAAVSELPPRRHRAFRPDARAPPLPSA